MKGGMSDPKRNVFGFEYNRLKKLLYLLIALLSLCCYDPPLTKEGRGRGPFKLPYAKSVLWWGIM